MRKLKRDETVLAREIDQQKYKKNLWRFDWLDEVVSLSWKYEKGQKTQDVKVGDALDLIHAVFNTVPPHHCCLHEKDTKLAVDSDKLFSTHGKQFCFNSRWGKKKKSIFFHMFPCCLNCCYCHWYRSSMIKLKYAFQGHFCVSKTLKTFSFWGLRPQTPTRGVAPGPYWGPSAAPRPPPSFSLIITFSESHVWPNFFWCIYSIDL